MEIHYRKYQTTTFIASVLAAAAAAVKFDTTSHVYSNSLEEKTADSTLNHHRIYNIKTWNGKELFLSLVHWLPKIKIKFVPWPLVVYPTPAMILCRLSMGYVIPINVAHETKTYSSFHTTSVVVPTSPLITVIIIADSFLTILCHICALSEREHHTSHPIPTDIAEMMSLTVYFYDMHNQGLKVMVMINLNQNN